MANPRFIKFIDSEESHYLLKHHPNAFLLLSLIALRARRTSGAPDGCEIGEAHIGDYQECGIETRDKYRHALKVLTARAHIDITETCRNRKKAPTGTPTGTPTVINTLGTKVKLLKSSVWDINLQPDFSTNPHQNPHINPHSTPTQPPPNPHEQECKEDKNVKKKEKIKKETPTQIPKISFRETVTLTQAEYEKLLALHGETLFSSMLDILDAYKGSKGATYTSDYHTMKQGGWVCKRAYLENSQEKKSSSIWMKFKHGESYNGWEFLSDKGTVGFYRSNGISQQTRQVRPNDPNFDNIFRKYLEDLEIKIPEN